MLSKMVCAAAGHSVDRHRVWFDSMEYRTACTRCGEELIRLPAGWKPYNPALHDHQSRLRHPRERG